MVNSIRDDDKFLPEDTQLEAELEELETPVMVPLHLHGTFTPSMIPLQIA